MKYQDLKAGIRSHLEDAAEDFFMVGYFLRQISENALFTEDGYKSIWEFAKGEYGLSTSSASRFMAINARFSIDGGEHMAEKYIGMGVSKLQEMLGLPDEELEKVTQETTVREIRAMKKKQEAPRSFYGFPKTERPEGSLLTTPGCGDGKYDDERKKEQAELQKRQKEAEGKKPDMTQKEIESLYGWLGIKPEDKITGAWLKEQHGRSYHGGGYGGDYFNCTPRGVKTERSKEMTWGEVAKALKEVQEKKKGLADLAERNAAAQKSLRDALKEKEQQRKEEKAAARKAEREAARQTAAEPENPDIIDADFREVEDEPKDDPAQEAAEARDERQEEPITQEPEPDPEEYSRLDVDLLLDKYRQDLKAYHEADCPPNMIKTQRILVDALALLLEQIDQGGAED